MELIKFRPKREVKKALFIRVRIDNGNFIISRDLSKALELNTDDKVSLYYLSTDSNSWFIKKETEDGFKLRKPVSGGYVLVFSAKDAAREIWKVFNFTGLAVEAPVIIDENHPLFNDKVYPILFSAPIHSGEKTA